MYKKEVSDVRVYRRGHDKYKNMTQLLHILYNKAQGGYSQIFPRIDPKTVVKITVNVESYYDHWVLLLSYFKTEDEGPGAAGMLPAMVLISYMGAKVVIVRFELENHEKMLLGMSPVRAASQSTPIPATAQPGRWPRTGRTAMSHSPSSLSHYPAENDSLIYFLAISLTRNLVLSTYPFSQIHHSPNSLSHYPTENDYITYFLPFSLK